jgi:hypothetical protein
MVSSLVTSQLSSIHSMDDLKLFCEILYSTYKNSWSIDGSEYATMLVLHEVDHSAVYREQCCWVERERELVPIQAKEGPNSTSRRKKVRSW